MWLSEEIVSVGKDEFEPRLGHITKVENNKVTVKADGDYKSIPIMMPNGINCIPNVGEEVVVFPMGSSAVCSTVAKKNTMISSGEMYLSNNAGAYIWLKNDGTVVINGQVFNKEG